MSEKLTTEIAAKVILDTTSIETGERMLTLMIKAPRFLDAELEKHCNIASNSSSGRAISFPMTSKQVEPFIPPVVQRPATTMHGDSIVNYDTYSRFSNAVTDLFHYSLGIMSTFKEEVHKQHLNRYIEAFTMQSKIMTGTLDAWSNLINLRSSKYADPNIQLLSKPYGENLGYYDDFDFSFMSQFKHNIANVIEQSKTYFDFNHIPLVTDDEKSTFDELKLVLMSAGRCAKFSFNNHNDESPERSVTRAKMLIEHHHKSPLEHQLLSDIKSHDIGVTHYDRDDNYYSGRARNWIQARKLIWIGLNEELYNPKYFDQ